MTEEGIQSDECASSPILQTKDSETQRGVVNAITRHKREFLIGCLLAGPTLGFIIAAVTACLLPREYLGRVRLHVVPLQGMALEFPSHEHELQAVASFHEAQFQIIKSKAAIDPLIDEFQLAKRWDLPVPEVHAALLKNLKTKIVEGTDLIDIEVHSANPVEAADLANAIGRSYLKLKIEAQALLVNRVVDTLNAHVTLQEQKVEDSRQNMVEIMEKHEFVDLGENVPVWTAARQMESHNVASDTLSTDSLLQRSKDRVKIEALRKAGLGENHPAILSIKTRKAEIDRQLTAGVEALRAQLEITENSVEQTPELRENIPEDERRSGAEYLAAKRNYETQNLILTDMRNALLKEKIDLGITPDPVEIHELAEPAESPSRPKVAWILLTGFLGGGIVLGLPIGLGMIYLSQAS